MVPTNAPIVVVPTTTDGLPTGAIVIIAIGGYMIIFAIILLIRKCIINKGGTCCPVWCSEICTCQNCCNNDPNTDGCCTSMARTCDGNPPNKRQCMDSVCPTKEWCDDTFCCCFSKQPQGECCNFCNGGGSNCDSCGGECCDCGECTDCCGDCKCDCCAQPESINCCCLEYSLRNGWESLMGRVSRYRDYMRELVDCSRCSAAFSSIDFRSIITCEWFSCNWACPNISCPNFTCLSCCKWPNCTCLRENNSENFNGYYEDVASPFGSSYYADREFNNQLRVITSQP